MQPILNKIKFKNLNKIKANLLTKDIKNTEHGMHVDQPEGTTGIFYINTCNGYTKFKNNKIIKIIKTFSVFYAFKKSYTKVTIFLPCFFSCCNFSVMQNPDIANSCPTAGWGR